MLLSLKMSPVKNAINAAKNIFLPRPQKKEFDDLAIKVSDLLQ
jgi:hypothetical protein